MIIVLVACKTTFFITACQRHTESYYNYLYLKRKFYAVKGRTFVFASGYRRFMLKIIVLSRNLIGKLKSILLVSKCQFKQSVG
jgi:hypothetical protein